ncbi:hypothetical protein ASD11_07375 [Aeromicrobium sp. Root495]|uniref:DUF1330 domain-containing protein n=1 Tax=Aeromicrobium sp. Root495 TaxID=1736550 RepID=UPI0006F9568F|nr:DUF1330 domain-containing protein [Aeromicrobium sp. Root495]KQY59380.1 hypothetical protein ASD11_07375 [Aeromicrobium sp. Root495]
MPVDPTGHDLKRYLAEDPGGPVVMLNLLQLAPGGRDSYEQYAREIAPFLERVGGEIVYAGDLSTELVVRPDPEPDWDVLLLVRYPSRQAFTAMVADPEYQQITHLRTQALSEAVLQASTPWAASAG